MNTNSLSHNYVQNQQPSSWIDDMFHIGTFADKGRQRMSNKKQLSEYSEELVAQYAKYNGDHYELTLNMLSDDDQNELVRWYIESIDREIEWACYGSDESINSEFLCAMISMFKDDNAVTRARFAEVTRNNILVYYKNNLNELLVTACDNFYRMQMNEAGYQSSYDQDNGDVVWGKF